MTPIAERITQLAASLGTADELARVNAELAALGRSITDSTAAFSRDELAQVLAVLDSLSVAILSMDRIAREMLGNAGSGALDCVG